VPLRKSAEPHEEKMKEQIDLISTGQVFDIAESCGWGDIGEIHKRLTNLARDGHLRSWGYEGNTSELRLIDPFVWQDHGLDIANDQLIVPSKFLAPDYAEHIWREVRWDRREIEAAFPLYSLMRMDSAPVPAPPSKVGEEECCKWLIQLMREGPKRNPKSHYQAEANRRFGVGLSAFNRAWDVAKNETKQWDWGYPGRLSKKS
jgi:hypothetical protein